MKNNLILSISLILIAVVSRLIPHAWNFTAMGAVAVTAGFLISNRTVATATVLISLLISDALIGLQNGVGFHNTMLTVYLGYVAMLFIGYVMAAKSESISKKSIFNVASSSLIGSLLFFIISNLGVWFEGQLYPVTQAGLINCFVMAVPFFKNELLSNLILAPILFLSFKYAFSFLNETKLIDETDNSNLNKI